MTKTSDKLSWRRQIKRLGWCRNPYAADLAKCRWWVTLDPDLAELLSGTGDPGNHLKQFIAKQKRSRRERLVWSILLSDQEYERLRTMLDRIGADVRCVPPHPNSKAGGAASRPQHATNEYPAHSKGTPRPIRLGRRKGGGKSTKARSDVR